ncbi:MAG TPA: calcium-binding protein [Oscillatoriaceae cyanobacterium M33_DOE_052]|uniref:Calcium-binding protein n=1 Tax=Planktothricoides sp. SpSt-374 TaxID=2282167 RepID=A0A7C3ZTZ5_9CYAN|nr:calcium-binding protein [Oscillatoriaceae cyanobacterium M33_DOE_052]
MAGLTTDGFYDFTAGDDTLTIETAPERGTIASAPQGVRALEGDDNIFGSTAADNINGNQGGDSLYGAFGDDYLRGGRDSDLVNGEDGSDILNGNKGEDFVIGGAGNDTVRGGQDADLLLGGEGNDLLIGDLGFDGLTGNAGADWFVLRSDAIDSIGGDALLDFRAAEGDKIILTGGLTEADLTFQEKNLSISDLINIFPLPGDLEIPPEFLTPQVFRMAAQQLLGVDIDPDGNNVITGTSIVVASTGAELGFAVNVTAADMTGNFQAAPPDLLSLG